jgi:hypothetical protein
MGCRRIRIGEEAVGRVDDSIDLPRTLVGIGETPRTGARERSRWGTRAEERSKSQTLERYREIK